MLNLKVEFERLEEDAFDDHDLLTRVGAKLRVLSVVGKLARHSDHIARLLRRLFGFPGQKEATRRRYVLRKVLLKKSRAKLMVKCIKKYTYLKRVKHVKAMKVDGGRRHRRV